MRLTKRARLRVIDDGMTNCTGNLRAFANSVNDTTTNAVAAIVSFD